MSIEVSDLCEYGAQLSLLQSEIEWRNAVGRCYYAAYLRAEAWHDGFPSHGQADAGRGVHATLISCLKKPTVGGQRKISSMSVGYMLEAMKALRTKADYKLHTSLDQAEAKTVAANAKMVLAKIDAAG